MTSFKIKGSGLMKFQPGGKVVGPSHNEGGVQAIDPTGEPVAEVEGDERIFSVEDTEEIEERAMEIKKFEKQEDIETANMLATKLGYRIVEMIDKQERINPS